MRSSGTLLCLASATAFGAMAVFGKLAYADGATVGTLLAARFTLAAGLFWIVVGISRPRRIGRRDLLLGLALGAAGYACQAGAYFAALARIDASLLSLLVYTFPAIVTVAAIALGRERADSRRLAALALSSAGLLLVLAGAGTGALDPLGAALGLAAALVYSAYILVGEPVAGRVGAPLLAALVCTGAAVTLTAGAAALGDLRPAAVTPAGWGWLACLAAVSTVGAIGLFFAALRRIGPMSTAILSTAEPLVTVVLALLVFGEALGAVQALGAMLILGAVLALHSRPRGAPLSGPLEGKVALVAGATRGAGRGIAVALGEAGATVYCSGRSTAGRPSEYERPETIEETAALVTEAGGTGIGVAADHLDPAAVEALVARIDAEQGRLDVLVNDIWGGERLFEWDTPVWEHDLGKGLRLLRLALDTHLITSHFALPLLIRRPDGLLVEMTDGTRAYNEATYRINAFYDLAKNAVIRLAFAQARELAPHGCTAVALTPGWLRSEMMLEAFGVTEANWREAAVPHFVAISETPRFAGRAVAALAADPDVHARNGGSFSSGGLAQEYGFTDVDGSRPDCWRYMVEVQDPGLPADSTGYR